MPSFPKNILNNIFEKKANNHTLLSIIVSLYTITFIRTFFENFSNLSQNNLFTSFSSTFVHYPLSYFAIFLSVILVFNLHTKVSIKDILNFSFPLFALILLTPPLDLILSHGSGWKISYIITQPQNIPSLFLSYFGPATSIGITPGMRIEVAIILLFVFIGAYHFTKNIIKSFSALFFSYAAIFFFLALPTFLSLFFNPTTNLNANLFFNLAVQQQWNHPFLYLINNGFLNSEANFDILLSSVYVITLFLIALIFLYIDFKKQFVAWFKYFQLKRIIFYLMFAVLGFKLNHNFFHQENFLNIFNLLSIVVFLLAFCLNYWLAVIINDIEDISLDTINDQTKPLIKNSLTLEHYHSLQLLIIFFLLNCLLLLPYQVSIFLVFFQGVYYVYSKYPFKLKRHFIFSSLAIGLNCSLIFLAGFYLASPTQTLNLIPFDLLLMFFIIGSIISNFKDLKDYKGDLMYGIKTIPVVFGLEKSKKILPLISIAIFLLFSIYLKSKLLSLVLLPISFYIILNFKKEKYNENFLFISFYLYMFILILVS